MVAKGLQSGAQWRIDHDAGNLNSASRSGYVSNCVQNRLRKTSGHGKRLIAEIDLLTKGAPP